MSSDDYQYKAYLRLKFPESNANSLFDLISSRKEVTDNKKREAEIIYSKRLKVKHESLFDLLLSKSKKISNVSINKRYAAYLVTEYGYAKACKLLYMSRTSLWRLLLTS